MARKMQCLSVIIYYHYKALLCRHTSFLFLFLRTYTSIAGTDDIESYASMDTSHSGIFKFNGADH